MQWRPAVPYLLPIGPCLPPFHPFSSPLCHSAQTLSSQTPVGWDEASTRWCRPLRHFITHNASAHGPQDWALNLFMHFCMYIINYMYCVCILYGMACFLKAETDTNAIPSHSSNFPPFLLPLFTAFLFRLPYLQNSTPRTDKTSSKVISAIGRLITPLYWIRIVSLLPQKMLCLILLRMQKGKLNS